MVDGGTLVTVRGVERERALSIFVERTLACDITFSTEGDVGIGVDDGDSRAYGLVDGDGGFLIVFEEHLGSVLKDMVALLPVFGGGVPVAIGHVPRVVRLIGLDVDHLRLLRLGLDSDGRGVVRGFIPFDRPHPYLEGASVSQLVESECLGVGFRLAHHFPCSVDEHLHLEFLLVVGEVVPLHIDAVVRGFHEREVLRCPEKFGAVFAVESVDIVLDIGVSVGSDGHGVVLGWIRSVGLLPFVRYAVLVGVGRFGERLDGPGGRCSDRELVLS